MITKEQFQYWCRETLRLAREREARENFDDRVEMLAEHDPKLAELERAGIEAFRRTAEYIRSRIES